jgi:hypothetical protein
MWRDPDGTVHYGTTGERWTERLIREAQERGAFDELPHRGRRLPIRDETYAGDMALAYHMLKNAGAAPPWIEADKQVRRLLAERDTILSRATTAGQIAAERYRRRLAEVIADLNAAIARVNAEAPPSAHRLRLDPQAELAELERRIASG